MTKEGAKKVYIYPVDTVLVCCTASVGECAMTKVPMGSNQQFNGLTIKNQEVLLPDFLLFVASTLKDKLLQFAGKTTINFVSRSSLERILSVSVVASSNMVNAARRSAARRASELTNNLTSLYQLSYEVDYQTGKQD